MKKANVQIGETYLVKVTGKLVPVKITSEHDNGGWEGTSTKTGKTIRIKSPQRLRKQLPDLATGATQAKVPSKDATSANERHTGERDANSGQPEAKAMSLLDAAAHLLSLGTGDPMPCKAIVDLAVARKLWIPGNGKTPANTLYASILREIKTKGDASRFIKVNSGKFALRH